MEFYDFDNFKGVGMSCIGAELFVCDWNQAGIQIRVLKLQGTKVIPKVTAKKIA